jgi:two-component system, NtrC family, response regulator AtoC
VKLLIADDEPNIRESIARFLASEGMDCTIAADGLQARMLLETEHFDGLVLDLRMPGLDGLSLLSWLRESGPSVPAIVISAYGEVRDAVQAMRLGARDYLVKPFDPEELILRVRRMLEESLLAGGAEASRRGAEGGKDSSLPWIGDADSMRAIQSLIERVAPTPSTVLITGESGTGKEVIARLLHSLSWHPDAPFAAINIGGIPDALLESELFGHEKGAFTGAVERKRGMLELAGSGTLFLDEIGDMPIQLQVKLLRVLQEKRVQRLGATQSFPIDARIVAATNKDLDELMKQGRFREDLYYRLNVIHIQVPPLRERRDDIPRLARMVVERLNRERGKKVRGIDGDAMARLREYNFPGNVRELENRIERAFILSSGDTILMRDLGDPFASSPRPKRQGKLRDNERELIERTLTRNGGNRTRAAAELGISRRTLQNRLKEFER